MAMTSTVFWCVVLGGLDTEPAMLFDLSLVAPLMIAFVVLHDLLLLAAVRSVRSGVHA